MNLVLLCPVSIWAFYLYRMCQARSYPVLKSILYITKNSNILYHEHLLSNIECLSVGILQHIIIGQNDLSYRVYYRQDDIYIYIYYRDDPDCSSQQHNKTILSGFQGRTQ